MDAAIGSGSSRWIARRKSVTYALVGAIAMYAIAASGASAADVERKVVIRGDSLAPQTAAEAEHLYGRIRRAARQVCGDRPGLRVMERLALRDCSRDAVSKAVDDVDNSFLTAIHMREIGETNGWIKVAESDANNRS